MSDESDRKHSIICRCDLCNPYPCGILAALNADDYTLGNLQCIPYNPPDAAYASIFPDNYLSALYSRMKSAGILSRTFCGMTYLTHDAILSYLATRPVFAAIQWAPDRRSFDTLGFGFIVTWNGVPPPAPGPRSAFAAYAMFPEAWGTPEAEMLGMLGLARMFYVYKLQDVFGQRYARNALTARFMARYGFRDIGTVPDFLLDKRDGALVMSDGVISRLTQPDFVRYVEGQYLSLCAPKAPVASERAIVDGRQG